MMRNFRFFLSLASALSFVSFAVSFSFCLSIFLSSCALEPPESSSAYVRQKSNADETDGDVNESGVIDGKANADEEEAETLENAFEIGEDWTVVVYMAADNSLESDAISDVNEMERAFIPSGMNVLVLLDRAEGYDASNDDWTDTRLFLIKHDADDSNKIISERLSSVELGLSFEGETELDMSNKSTLSALLSFARKNYHAEKYALIVWGHGTGWRNQESVSARAFAVDEGGGKSSYMTIPTMRKAIESGMGEERLSFLGFDTCFGCCLETAFEFRNLSKFMAGSPSTEPQSGWDYFAFFDCLDSDAAVLKGEDLCESAISQFRCQYETCANASFCVLNLENCASAVESFNDFSEAAAKRVTSYAARDSFLELFREKCVSYCAGSPGDFYADSLDFVRNACLQDESLSECARKVEDAYSLFVRKSWNSSSENGSCSPGVFVAVQKSPGVFISHPSAYINGSPSVEVSQFVSFASSYVPTKRSVGSLLDKLFYSVLEN